MDWKQELLKRLDSLGAALGNTGAHLWEVLVRQSIAMGVADAILALICLVAMFVFLRYARKCWLLSENRQGYIALTGLLIVGTCITFFAFGVNTYSATLELINPEYYALEKVLQTVGK